MNLYQKLLADEIERGGDGALAGRIRDGSDNSIGGRAALRAMEHLVKHLASRSEKRQRVYFAFDTERDYQDRKKDENGYATHEHELAAYVTFVDDYLTEAKHIISRDWTPQCYPRTLDTLRKVGALCVAAMEAHGAPIRL